MKIRTNFVSNSSTSSFVMFVKKEDFDEVVKTLTNLERDILREVTNPEVKKAFGLSFKEIAYMSGNYSSLECYSYDGKLTDDEQDKLDNEGAECIAGEICGKFNKYETLSSEVEC